MRQAIPFDPAVHKIRELEVARQLRRDTGDPQVMSYFHEGTENWLIALLSADRKWLLEIDYISVLSDGKSTSPRSREEYQYLLKLLTVFTTKDRMKRNLLSWNRSQVLGHLDENERFTEALQGMYRFIHRNDGAVAAERYAQNVGISNMGPSTIMGT